MLGLIRPAFRYAQKNDFILKNPMNVVDKPSETLSETRYYTAEQLNALAKAAKGSYIETPVILAMVLGLRRSEIVGITWDNVDFENRLLHIIQSVIVGDSSILPHGTYKVIGHTNSRKPKDIILKYFLKTDSSVRSFTMYYALYNYLKALKAEQEVMIRETNAYKDYAGHGDFLTTFNVYSYRERLLVLIPHNWTGIVFLIRT